MGRNCALLLGYVLFPKSVCLHSLFTAFGAATAASSAPLVLACVSSSFFTDCSAATASVAISAADGKPRHCGPLVSHRKRAARGENTNTRFEPNGAMGVTIRQKETEVD